MDFHIMASPSYKHMASKNALQDQAGKRKSMEARWLEVIMGQAWRQRTVHGLTRHWLQLSHMATPDHKRGWKVSTRVPRK